MSSDQKPPFHADHVGSLLRPPEIFAARDQLKKGEISTDNLWEVENEAIRDAVRLQESIGLKSTTDGEFRRNQWWVDFSAAIEGVEIQGGIPIHFQSPEGEMEHAPPKAVVAENCN
mgnify:CR=1 FL=1